MNNNRSLSRRLADVVEAFSAAIHDTVSREYAKIAGGLSLNQIGILETIYFHPGIAQKAIAEINGLTAASVSVTLRSLENDGFIERRQSETDGRQMEIYLGPQGQRLMRDTRRITEQAMEEFLEPLSMAQQQELISTLERLMVAHHQREDHTETV